MWEALRWEFGQMALAVMNDAGWMTRSKGSESTRRGESHNNGLPYDYHVMSKPESLMYFEKIKRRPSKMGTQQQLVDQRDKRDMREKPREVKWTERKIPTMSKRRTWRIKRKEWSSTRDDQREHVATDDVGRKNQVPVGKNKFAS